MKKARRNPLIAVQARSVAVMPVYFSNNHAPTRIFGPIFRAETGVPDSGKFMGNGCPAFGQNYRAFTLSWHGPGAPPDRLPTNGTARIVAADSSV